MTLKFNNSLLNLLTLFTVYIIIYLTLILNNFNKLLICEGFETINWINSAY